MTDQSHGIPPPGQVLDQTLVKLDKKIASQEARVREQESRINQLELLARAHGLILDDDDASPPGTAPPADANQ